MVSLRWSGEICPHYPVPDRQGPGLKSSARSRVTGQQRRADFAVINRSGRRREKNGPRPVFLATGCGQEPFGSMGGRPTAPAELTSKHVYSVYRAVIGSRNAQNAGRAPFRCDRQGGRWPIPWRARPGERPHAAATKIAAPGSVSGQSGARLGDRVAPACVNPMSAKASSGPTRTFNILIVAQSGRLQYEAVLFAASLRHSDPGFAGRLIVAVPEPGPLWSFDPGLSSHVTALLQELGAEVHSFTSEIFGESYPYGNKIEALKLLPAGEPFVFFDTDTLVTGRLSEVAFEFDRPSASMRREGTWPEIELYGPGYGEIWKSLYDRFGLDYDSSLDRGQPDEYWERYLYFNAGWFYARDPAEFHALFARYAREIRDDPPEALVCQSFDPWLDQIALPLVIHALGGGRPEPELAGLDGDVTCHWRVLPLLFARESDRVVDVLKEVSAPNRIKKVLKEYEPFKRMIFQNKGDKARALFDRSDLPPREQMIRNRLKKNNLWLR